MFKVHPFSLALTGGLLIGIYTFGFTLISLWTDGYGADFLQMWEPLHPGYTISYVGSIVGFAYSFVEGFFWLFVGGHIYNFFVHRWGRH